MAKPGTGPAQIVRRKLVDCSLLGTLAHHAPDDLLADARAPHGAAMADAAEDKPFSNARCRQPFVHSSLYPAGHRHRAYMATFAEQVNNGPVLVALLQVRHLQAGKLGAPQAATQ